MRTCCDQGAGEGAGAAGRPGCPAAMPNHQPQCASLARHARSQSSLCALECNKSAERGGGTGKAHLARAGTTDRSRALMLTAGRLLWTGAAAEGRKQDLGRRPKPFIPGSTEITPEVTKSWSACGAAEVREMHQSRAP